LGYAACLSFFPSKNLGGYGDGGMVVTDDPELADTVRKLRTHGWQKKYYPEVLGFNSRLDELQAAILRVKLKYLDRWNKQRHVIASKYRPLLEGTGIELPWEAPYAKHVYHLYIVRMKGRESVQEHLRSAGIASSVYYPLPLHLVEPYRHLGYTPGAFPEADQASRETLAIPLYPEMQEEQIQAVVQSLRQVLMPAKN
jgi:dTDP-4-amino-4,6-dideoxygalactose transaminase